MALSPEEIQDVLALGHELRHIEFKSRGERTDKRYQAVVARAAMAMGNLPDGGHVILGVADAGGVLTPHGVNDDLAAQWTDHDQVADVLARFSDPVPVVHIEVVEVAQVKLVDIQVEPFADTPYLCRRDAEGILQAGRMYVRRTGKAETGNPSHHELREVLDRAAAQRFRTLLSILGSTGAEIAAQTPAAEQRYAQERDAIDADNDRMAFEDGGHWVVSVAPDEYQPDRIPRLNLEQIIEAATVRLRGWPVPFVDFGSLLQGQRYIGGEILDARHDEGWRLFISGQFFEKRSFSAETRARRARDGRSMVDIWEILFHPAEIYILAARLSEQMPDVAAMTVRLALNGLLDTELRSEPERELFETYRTDEPRIEVQATVPVGELLPRAEELALNASVEMLRAFGLATTRAVLADYQQSLLGHGHGTD